MDYRLDAEQHSCPKASKAGSRVITGSTSGAASRRPRAAFARRPGGPSPRWAGSHRHSEAFGGLGFGGVERALIGEAFGRHLVSEPYLASTVLAGALLLDAGDETAKAEWLPRMASGEARLAFAHAERKGRFDLHHIERRRAAPATPGSWTAKRSWFSMRPQRTAFSSWRGHPEHPRTATV